MDAEASARTNADAVITADVATRLVSNLWADADSTTNYLARTGDRMTGDLDMGANSITNIATNSLVFADGTSIAATNVHAWNAAYGWGDHASGDATLQANLDAEGAARLTADGLLTTNLNQEIADRIAAVDAEASARTNADTVITADVATRLVSNLWADADSTTNYLARTGDRMTGDLDMGANSITNIATNSLVFADGTSIAATNVHAWNAAYGWGDHASGDATLQANLDAEGAARLTADGLLTTNLNQEIADRIAAVDAEASARTNADAVITADVATRLVSNLWADADSTTNYLARTGDRMTGDLDMGANSITNIATNSLVFADGTSIAATNVHAWNAAYGWGDHASGDATLQANLDAEGAARLTADGLLTTNLNQEIADRIAAVDAEASARTNADAVITADVATRLVSNVWAAADSTTNYLARTGGSMTGALALPAGGLTVGTTQLVVLANGNVGIGTGNPTNKLAVSGTIKAKEVIVTVDGWSDFVFEDGYRLMPLTEVDQFINSHGHLPGIPSARTVKRNGVRTGEMHARLLQKIEEMTLHLIRLERENAELRETIEDIRSTDSDESVDGGAWNAGGEE